MLKRNKVKKATIALSALLLMGTAMNTAQARFTDDLAREERSKPAAAAAVIAVKGVTQEHEGWWSDYAKSGKQAAEYIDSIAKDNPKAALWFLLTGGKYGFRKTPATPEEAQLMSSAMGKIAVEFGKNENKDAALEAWKQADLTRDGQAHLKLIYDKLNEFEARIDTLTGANGTLTRDLAAANSSITGLNGRVSGLEAENAALRQQLSTLHVTTATLTEKVAGFERERNQLNATIAAMQDKTDNLQTQVTDLTARLANSLEKQDKLNTELLRRADDNTQNILRVTREKDALRRDLEAKLEVDRNEIRQERERLEAQISEQRRISNDVYAQLAAQISAQAIQVQDIGVHFAAAQRSQAEAEQRYTEAAAALKQREQSLQQYMADQTANIARLSEAFRPMPPATAEA